MKYVKLVVSTGLMTFLFSVGLQAHEGHHHGPPKECKGDPALATGGACADKKGKDMMMCLEASGAAACQAKVKEMKAKWEAKHPKGEEKGDKKGE